MSTDNIDYETDALARKVSDKAQAASASARKTIGDAANSVSDAATKASAQARELYGRVAGRIDPLVQEKPYATLAAAVGIGLIAGLLVAGRGPKVIYIHPKT